MNKCFVNKCEYRFLSGWKWKIGRIIPSFPLLFCESPVSMKGQPARKKNTKHSLAEKQALRTFPSSFLVLQIFHWYNSQSFGVLFSNKTFLSFYARSTINTHGMDDITGTNERLLNPMKFRIITSL